MKKIPTTFIYCRVRWENPQDWCLFLIWRYFNFKIFPTIEFETRFGIRREFQGLNIPKNEEEKLKEIPEVSWLKNIPRLPPLLKIILKNKLIPEWKK